MKYDEEIKTKHVLLITQELIILNCKIENIYSLKNNNYELVNRENIDMDF